MKALTSHSPYPITTTAQPGDTPCVNKNPALRTNSDSGLLYFMQRRAVLAAAALHVGAVCM